MHTQVTICMNACDVIAFESSLRIANETHSKSNAMRLSKSFREKIAHTSTFDRRDINIAWIVRQIVILAAVACASAQFGRPARPPVSPQQNYGGGKVIAILRQSQDVNYDGSYQWKWVPCPFGRVEKNRKKNLNRRKIAFRND